MNTYKKGDKVQFIHNKNLGIFSGKTGTIEEMMDDSMVSIQDDTYHSTHVYKVYVPLHGTISVLDGFIKPMQQVTDTEKLTALIDFIKDAERYHLDNVKIGIHSSADKSMAVQDIICFIENELGIECEQLPSKYNKTAHIISMVLKFG